VGFLAEGASHDSGVVENGKKIISIVSSAIFSETFDRISKNMCKIYSPSTAFR